MTYSSEGVVERENETVGGITWHSSGPDSGPDVGISVYLGKDDRLWLGAISRRTFDENNGGAHFDSDDGWFILRYHGNDTKLIAKCADEIEGREFIEQVAEWLRKESEAAALIEELRGKNERLQGTIKWTDEVYPARISAGGAGVEITWDEFNRMREAAGFRPVKRIGDEEGRAGHNHKLRVRALAAESEVSSLKQELTEARDSIALAENMLSSHIEEFHDFDYEPHDVPLELAGLRHIQHHLMGSLIDESDGTSRSGETAGGFPVAAAPSQAEETGVIHPTRQWAGIGRRDGSGVTAGETAPSIPSDHPPIHGVEETIERCAQFIQDGVGMADLIDQELLDEQARLLRSLTHRNGGVKP